MSSRFYNPYVTVTARSPGALAWNADQLSSGSRDRMILQRDIRTPPLQSERRLQGHRQEVCGLKWSTDHQLLASGGNDNKVPVTHTYTNTQTLPVQLYKGPDLRVSLVHSFAPPNQRIDRFCLHTMHFLKRNDSVKKLSSFRLHPVLCVCVCQAPGVEPFQPEPGPYVHRPRGGGEGYRLVPPPARATGLRRGHG